MTRASTVNPFAMFDRQRTVLLTTYRRDGRAVGTAISIAIVGDHAVFRTYDRAWKTRRLAHTPRIRLAPSTARGRPTGQAIDAVAHHISRAEARAAAWALRRKHPVLHGVLVQLGHRIRRYTTLYFRIDLPVTDRGHGDGAGDDQEAIMERDSEYRAP